MKGFVKVLMLFGLLSAPAAWAASVPVAGDTSGGSPGAATAPSSQDVISVEPSVSAVQAANRDRPHHNGNPIVAIPRGYYFSLLLGASNFGDGEMTVDGKHLASSGMSVTWGGNWGYQFNKHFAAELGYLDFSEVDYKNHGDRLARTDDAYAYTSLVKAMLSPIDSWTLYGKAGIGYMNLKINYKGPVGAELDDFGTHNQLVPVVGLGAGYAMNEHVEVNVQDTTLIEEQDIPLIQVFSLGVTYHY